MEKQVHFDLEAFRAALDAQREARKLSWRDVAKQTGVHSSTLTRIGQGKMPDVANFALLVNWLGLNLDTFMRGVEKGKPETLAIISSCLHNDSCLTHEYAALIDGLVRKTYEQLCR